MKELFDQLKSITDILNVGRLVFYSAAGACLVLPLYLVVRVMVLGIQPTFSDQLAHDLRSLASPAVSSLWLFAASLIMGFLIAAVSFLSISKDAGPIAEEVRQEVKDRRYSVTYNYPLLRQKPDEDYANWLVSEYYRYVEIVTLLPIGAIGGLALSAVYAATFVVRDLGRPTMPGFTGAHAILPIALVSLVVIWEYGWPDLWNEHVVLPTLRSYLVAKRNLLDGLQNIEKAVNLSAAPEPEQ